jgi:hypothetical protein
MDGRRGGGGAEAASRFAVLTMITLLSFYDLLSLPLLSRSSSYGVSGIRRRARFGFNGMK